MFQISEVLKKVPFFQSLGRDGIDFIIERLKFKVFENEDAVCRAGDGQSCRFSWRGGCRITLSCTPPVRARGLPGSTEPRAVHLAANASEQMLQCALHPSCRVAMSLEHSWDLLAH